MPQSTVLACMSDMILAIEHHIIRTALDGIPSIRINLRSFLTLSSASFGVRLEDWLSSLLNEWATCAPLSREDMIAARGKVQSRAFNAPVLARGDARPGL